MARTASAHDDFAEFIYNMREAADITRDDLANLLSLSITTFEQYERGEKLPDNPDQFENELRKLIKLEIRKKRRNRHIKELNAIG
jgi:transcriptional regulator with XRE-family HTH domain